MKIHWNKKYCKQQLLLIIVKMLKTHVHDRAVTSDNGLQVEIGGNSSKRLWTTGRCYSSSTWGLKDKH